MFTQQPVLAPTFIFLRKIPQLGVMIVTVMLDILTTWGGGGWWGGGWPWTVQVKLLASYLNLKWQLTVEVFYIGWDMEQNRICKNKEYKLQKPQKKANGIWTNVGQKIFKTSWG